MGREGKTWDNGIVEMWEEGSGQLIQQTQVQGFSGGTVLSTQINFTHDDARQDCVIPAGYFKHFLHTSRGRRVLFSHSLSVFGVFLTHERSKGLLAEVTLQPTGSPGPGLG